MALKQKFDQSNKENLHGFTFKDAYHVVASIDIQVPNNISEEETIGRARIGIITYADEEARKNAKNKDGLRKKFYILPLEDLGLGINTEVLIKAAYKHVKTQEEFKDAKDC